MIELINVSRTFYLKEKKIEALKNVSLKVEKRDIYGIIGYSGAGKSTLIRCINLLEKPDSGDVRANGNSLISLSNKELRKARQNIGMIFQHFNLMNSINVYDNIAAPLKNKGMSKAETEHKVNELLKLVDLEDKRHAYPKQLSGGQKQRVAIARAISCDPEILLCDEATSALDPNTTKSILKLLKKIRDERGITIVIITHQMEVVKNVCNKVAIMEKGEIVERGDLIKIFASPESEIAKDFISQTMHSDELLDKIGNSKKNLYKISFMGDTTGEPFIAKLMKEKDVLVNILFGNIENLSDCLYGNLIVEIIGEDIEVEESIEYLQKQNVKVEVVINDK